MDMQYLMLVWVALGRAYNPRILGKANDLSYSVGGHNQPILVPQGSTKPYSIKHFRLQ